MRRFVPRKELNSYKRAFATANGRNLDTYYGLKLIEYGIDEAEPDLKLIYVPGRPDPIDATLSINGRINYLPREVYATFECHGSYEEHHELVKQLRSLYHGKDIEFGFSFDSPYYYGDQISLDYPWYYKGRFSVKEEKTNPVTSTITFICPSCHPYKLRHVSKVFNVSGELLDSIHVDQYAGMVVVTPDSEMELGVNYEYFKTLEAGANILYDLNLNTGTNWFGFEGNGKVIVSYEEGEL